MTALSCLLLRQSASVGFRNQGAGHSPAAGSSCQTTALRNPIRFSSHIPRPSGLLLFHPLLLFIHLFYSYIIITNFSASINPYLNSKKSNTTRSYHNQFQIFDNDLSFFVNQMACHWFLICQYCFFFFRFGWVLFFYFLASDAVHN